MLIFRRHQFDLVAFTYFAIDHTNQGNNTEIVIKPGIDYQGLKRRIRVTGRLGNTIDNLFQHLLNTTTGFGTDFQRILCLDTDNVFDFLFNTLGLSRWQVYLVQNRDHFKAKFHGGVTIGYALRFHTLGCINDQ